MSMFVLHHGDNSFPRLLSTSLSKRRERLCWSLAERCPKVLRYFEIHPLPIDRPCASPKAHSEYYHTHTNQKYQAVPECARLSQKSGTHCARVSHVLNQTARWRRSKWSTGLRCNGWDAASLQERSRVLQVCVSRREPFAARSTAYTAILLVSHNRGMVQPASRARRSPYVRQLSKCDCLIE